MSFSAPQCHSSSFDQKHASSPDPHVQPVIEPNYVSEELDLAILLDSMKFIRKLTATEEWKAVGDKEILPGPEADTDEKLLGKNSCNQKHAFAPRLTEWTSRRSYSERRFHDMA